MLDVGAYTKALEVPALSLSAPSSRIRAAWDVSGLSGGGGALHV